MRAKKRSRPEPDAETDAAVAAIVRRFLRSRALVGLAELTRRYPIDAAVATDLLERFADEGGLVRVDGANGAGGPQWADRQNLDEVRRLSVAIRRRESVAVSPEAFADFVARRQLVHPAGRREGLAAVGLVLEELQGFAAPAAVWESELLPRRVRDYRPAWLDETLLAGGWTWRAEADGKGDPRVAFVPRDFPGPWPVPSDVEDRPEPSEAERKIRDQLRQRGASFAVDLARGTGLSPSAVRAALDALALRAEATNDRFDPLRPGARDRAEALAATSTPPPTRTDRFGRSRPNLRRPGAARPEGRWSLLPGPPAAWSGEEAESAYLNWAAILLGRYGVLARETVVLDPWAPPWRDLAPWLDRAEMRGELRRGFFVEGVSGVQYTTAEVVEGLARSAARLDHDPAPVWLNTLDPANLYGSGAPFDVPLLEGGTARLPRNPGNAVVLVAGRPILIVEAYGKRLTGLASASEDELRAACGLLPHLAGPGRRVLKVETYNTAATLASPAAPWLADAGFVRDFPGMAFFYAGW